MVVASCSLLLVASSLTGLVSPPPVPLRWQPRRATPPRCCDSTPNNPATEAPPPAAEPTQQAAEPTQQAAEPTPKKTYSSDWSGAGKFADEDPLPLSFWMFGNLGPRRAILSALPFYFIGPAVNLWGSGSFLLSLFPDLARDKRLDTFYPVGTQRFYPYSAGFPNLNYDEGFKRFYDESGRYEFRYPARCMRCRTNCPPSASPSW